LYCVISCTQLLYLLSLRSLLSRSLQGSLKKIWLRLSSCFIAVVVGTALVKMFPAFILVVLLLFISATIFMYFLQILYPCMDLRISSKHALSRLFKVNKTQKLACRTLLFFSISCFKIYMVSVVDRLCWKPYSSCILYLVTIFPARIFINIFKIELSKIISL